MSGTVRKRISLFLAILMALAMTQPIFAEGRLVPERTALRAEGLSGGGAQIVFAKTSTLEAGKEYLIVTRGNNGNGYALSHSGSTVAEKHVMVSHDAESGYLISAENAGSATVWTYTDDHKLTNDNLFLRVKNATTLTVDATDENNVWTYESKALFTSYNGTKVYFVYRNNHFTAYKNSGDIYLYVKTTLGAAEAATSVTVTPTETALAVGGTAALTASVLPDSLSDRTVRWSSSDETVATVSGAGVVTANAAGTAIITAESNLTAGVKGFCTVTVTETPSEAPVYYLSFVPNGIFSDEDVYAEVDPGASVTADIYLAASNGGSKLEAFEIHLTADDALTWKETNSATGWSLNHSDSDCLISLGHSGDDRLEIPQKSGVVTDGLKLATVRYELSREIVYDTPYEIAFGAGTEICTDKAGAEKATIASMTSTGQAGFETLKQITVTFCANGGQGSDRRQSLPYHKGTALEECAFTRAGYTFTAWNTLENGTGDSYTDMQTVTLKQELTLYAQWKANTYQVKFNGNGSTSGSMEDQDFTYDQEQPLRKNAFAKTGHSFQGWTKNKDAKTADYSDEQSVKNLAESGTVTLYAVWAVDSHTVSFDMKGIGTQIDPQSVKHGEKALRPADPTDEAYRFEGWHLDEDCTQEFDFETAIEENVMLYAKWTKKTYTVEFLWNDGTDKSVKKTVEHGQTVALPEEPVRTGYAFKGWSGKGGAFDGTAPVTGDLTLQAQWEPISYTVTFQTDGGTPVAEMHYTIESGNTLPSCEKTHYTFTGWTVSSGEGSWTVGDAVSAGTSLTGRHGNVTLTAQWSFALQLVAENYRYARSGDVMIRIADPLNDSGKVLTFDGAPMYYTTNPDYTDDLGSSGVYVYLISSRYVESGALNAAGQALIGTADISRASVTYSADGNVNNDGTITIADANAVYQMLEQGADVYTYQQLSILSRLKADVSSEKTNATNRGSIKDVEAIMNIILDRFS